MPFLTRTSTIRHTSTMTTLSFLRRTGAATRAAAGLAMAATVLSLAGCGTSVISKNLDAQGKAAELVWPDPARDAWLTEGSFPNLENLRKVDAGLTKNQLYPLLGVPHFREGIGGVREWDYLFNFRTAGGVTRCQYKVLFDDAHVARSFHWLPANCADLIRPPAVAPAVAAVPAPANRNFQLAADALFPFDKGALADLTALGRLELDRVAGALKDARYERLDVVGHTDRLGSDAYNQALSSARASAVREYLIQRGLPATKIRAVGVGESEPLVQCADSLPRNTLIGCLQPNRRVDVKASGER